MTEPSSTSAVSERADDEQRLRSERSRLRLWLGLLVPGAVFLLALSAEYALVPEACARNDTTLLHVIALVSLIVALAGGGLAWREWSALGRGWPGEEPGPVARSRFMAVLGMMTSAMFSLVIVAQWMPMLILNPCIRA